MGKVSSVHHPSSNVIRGILSSNYSNINRNLCGLRTIKTKDERNRVSSNVCEACGWTNACCMQFMAAGPVVRPCKGQSCINIRKINRNIEFVDSCCHYAIFWCFVLAVFHLIQIQRPVSHFQCCLVAMSFRTAQSVDANSKKRNPLQSITYTTNWNTQNNEMFAFYFRYACRKCPSCGIEQMKAVQINRIQLWSNSFRSVFPIHVRSAFGAQMDTRFRCECASLSCEKWKYIKWT